MWNIPCLSDLKKKPSYSKSTRDFSFHFETPNCSLQLKVRIPEGDSDPFIPFMKVRSLQFSTCTLLRTLSKQIIQKTQRKWDFPPSPWASRVLLHTNSILPQFLLQTYLCLFIRFGVFSPSLSLKKNGALFIRLWSMKNYLFRGRSSQMWEGPSNFLRSFPNWLTTRILTREAFLEQPRATMAWTSLLVFLMHLQYWSPVLNYHD